MNLKSKILDEEIEREFKYVMPDDLRERFSNTEDISFNVRREYEKAMDNNEKSKIVIERSIEQHSQMCIENSEDVFDARELAKAMISSDKFLEFWGELCLIYIEAINGEKISSSQMYKEFLEKNI